MHILSFIPNFTFLFFSSRILCFGLVVDKYSKNPDSHARFFKELVDTQQSNIVNHEVLDTVMNIVLCSICSYYKHTLLTGHQKSNKPAFIAL